ncbi:MAG: 50S ribosomal protein L32 [Patescibacteria group bacterium]
MGRSSHHSTSKVGRRRSQLALKPKKLLVCSACKGPTFSHRACPQCGVYLKSAKKISVKTAQNKAK